jgi:hypothetical protein
MEDLKLKKAKELIGLGFLASLTLGLAPFYPEPHIIGKVRWVLGGAVGMKLIDWWDFIMHGTPWLILFYALDKIRSFEIW